MIGILSHDISSVYKLLVDLAHYLECPHALPSFLSLVIIHNQVHMPHTFFINHVEHQWPYSNGNGARGVDGRRNAILSAIDATKDSRLSLFHKARFHTLLL
jgi:hypothetical protein